VLNTVCVTEVIVKWLAFLIPLQEIPGVDLGHPTILIVAFPNFPQSLQENLWDGPTIRSLQLASRRCKIIIHLTVYTLN
jgi:hypothetical protein